MGKAIRIVDELSVVQEVTDLYITWNSQIRNITKVFVANQGTIRQCWPSEAETANGIVLDPTEIDSHAVNDPIATAVCLYNCRSGNVTLTDGAFNYEIPAINPVPRGQGVYLYRLELVSGDDVVVHFGPDEFAPTDIAGCNVWLDASDPGASPTTQWDDKSGQGNHFTVTDSNEVTFAGGVCSFSGLTGAEIVGPDLSSLTQGEIFIVLKRDATATATGTDTGWMTFGTDSQTDHYTYSGQIYTEYGTNTRKACGTPPVSITDWRTINIWSVVNDWNLNIDGTSLFSTAANIVSFSNPVRFGHSLSGYNFFGEVVAIIHYDHKLTPTERAQVQAYCDSINPDIGGGGPSGSEYGWHDVLEEGTIARYDNYLSNNSVGIKNGQVILSFAEDDGTGNPVADTIVSKTINLIAEVVSDRITMSTIPWTLDNVEVNELAEVAVLVTPKGWWDEVNQINIPDSVITGEFGHPKGIQESEIYAVNLNNDVRVQCDVISGAVIGDDTGVSLSTDEQRQWKIEADEPDEIVNAVIDITISDGLESVTKRITMRAEQQSEASDSEIDDEFTRYDEIIDTDSGPVGQEQEAWVGIRVNKDGTVDAIYLNDGPNANFPQNWNTAAPTVPDPENYEASLSVEAGGTLFPSHNNSIFPWTATHNITDEPYWVHRTEFSASAGAGTITKEGYWRLRIQEVGRPETAQIKRFKVRVVLEKS